MSDLSRWADGGGGASAFERDVLRAAENPSPPRGTEQQVWAALVAAMGPACAAAAAAQTASSQATGSAAAKTAAVTVAGKAAVTVAAKAIVIGTLGAATVGGAAYLVQRAAQTRAPVAVAARRAVDVRAPDSPVATAPAIAPTAATVPGVAPERAADAPRAAPAQKPAAAPPIAEPAPSAPGLEQEARMLADVRARLRRGDTSGAAAALDTLRASFPSGMLAQEREAVAIEILVTSGNAAEADRRARAFLAAFPDSPHAAKVRRALLVAGSDTAR
jgi:hypothetical protein